MAITKKAREIQQEKRKVRDEFDRISSEIAKACHRVPHKVICGDAVLAVLWRTAAEKNFNKALMLGDSLTLPEMRQRIDAAMSTLNYLRHPYRV